MIQVVPEMDANITIIQGLDPHATYCVQISATNGAGSSPSSEVKGTAASGKCKKPS